MIAIHRFQLPDGLCPFDAWLGRLADRQVKLRVLARLEHVASGNLGDYAGVGEGVLELRLHFGQGWRIYRGRRGAHDLVLFCAGSKATQSRDIELAKRYWSQWKGIANG